MDSDTDVKERLIEKIEELREEGQALRDALDHVQRENAMLKEALGEESAVLRFLNPEPLRLLTTTGKDMRHIAFPMGDKTMLLLVHVGSEQWEPTPNEMDVIVDAVSTEANDLLPADYKCSVICLRHDARVDAILVKKTEAE